MRVVIYPYCNDPATMVKGDRIYLGRPDLAHLNFWLCAPCSAWVGCHRANPGHGRDGTEPLGRLANADLRAAKQRAHAAFDPYWKNGGLARADAYAWLAASLGIPKDACHIGLFDLEMCRRVVQICTLRRTVPAAPAPADLHVGT